MLSLPVRRTASTREHCLAPHGNLCRLAGFWLYPCALRALHSFMKPPTGTGEIFCTLSFCCEASILCATCQRSCGLAASPRAVTCALRGLRYFPPVLQVPAVQHLVMKLPDYGEKKHRRIERISRIDIRLLLSCATCRNSLHFAQCRIRFFYETNRTAF